MRHDGEGRPLPTIHERFADACASELDFLVRDHGFEACAPEIHAHECSIAYRKPPNMVLIAQYEPGNAPWMVVSARLGPGGRRAIQLPLHRLARRRDPDWRPPEFEEGSGGDAMRDVMRCYAALLTETFPDLLEAADGIGARLQ